MTTEEQINQIESVARSKREALLNAFDFNPERPAVLPGSTGTSSPQDAAASLKDSIDSQVSKHPYLTIALSLAAGGLLGRMINQENSEKAFDKVKTLLYAVAVKNGTQLISGNLKERLINYGRAYLEDKVNTYLDTSGLRRFDEPGRFEGAKTARPPAGRITYQ